MYNSDVNNLITGVTNTLNMRIHKERQIIAHIKWYGHKYASDSQQNITEVN